MKNASKSYSIANENEKEADYSDSHQLSEITKVTLHTERASRWQQTRVITVIKGKTMKETSGINGVAAFPTINFKSMLYLLVSIAVLFIAIIPARIISGIFSQDESIFYISFAGFTALMEFMAWLFLCAPIKIYESTMAKEAMSEEFVIAEAQTESELSNDEIVSGEPDMLLAMKEETKDIITSSSMIDLYR